jgi:hypothetical protein
MENQCPNRIGGFIKSEHGINEREAGKVRPDYGKLVMQQCDLPCRELIF